MNKQARLESASLAWRFVIDRVQALAPALPGQIISTLRLARRVLARSQPRTWRFALLPIAVAVSALIAAGASIAWGLVAAEALAAICALSGWAALRAYKPVSQSDIPYLGMGVGLLVVAALTGLSLLASASALTLTLGALALALIALDLAPASLRNRLPRATPFVARRIVAPILLGLGIVMVTALAQRARPDVTLWLLGATLSLLVFATIQAHAMVVDGSIRDEKALWRRPFIPLAGALALAGALIVGAALPVSAPHGLLLALGALPVALVAVTGLWRSTFLPARAWAAHRVSSVFTFVALALIAGALVSALVAAAGAALAQALGG